MSFKEEGIRKTGAGKTILIVEDDSDIGLFLITALTEEDAAYHALLVPDGLRALDVVCEVNPQLVILDYHLPRIDGLEVFDRMSRIKGLKMAPSIMISSNLPQLELEKRSIVGMQKPFELDEFLDLVGRLLEG